MGRRAWEMDLSPGHGALNPEAINKALDARREVYILHQRGFHAIAGMHDRRMVAAAEFFSDPGQGRICEFAREIHGDLTREGDPFGTALRLHLLGADAEELGDRPLDRGNRDGPDTSLG